MAQRPTVADFLVWADLQSDAEEGDGSPIDLTLSAVRAAIEDRCSKRMPTDYLDVDATDYPERVKTAILMQAKEVYMSRLSQGGAAAFANLSGQLGTFTSDVDFLLASYLNLDGFA